MTELLEPDDYEREHAGEEIVNVAIELEWRDAPLWLRVRAQRLNYGRGFLSVRFAADRPISTQTGVYRFGHPFYRLDPRDITDTNEVGVIVADNDLTRFLVRHVAMTDGEIEQALPGTKGGYRELMIGFLSDLWD